MEARDGNTKKTMKTIEEYGVLHKWFSRLATPNFWQKYFLRICSYYRTVFYIYRGLLQHIFDLSKQSDCELGKNLNIQKKRVLIFNFKGSLLEKMMLFIWWNVVIFFALSLHFALAIPRMYVSHSCKKLSTPTWYFLAPNFFTKYGYPYPHFSSSWRNWKQSTTTLEEIILDNKSLVIWQSLRRELKFYQWLIMLY